MAEEISDPLLALIREQGLLDDLQYEEVVAEYKRNATSVSQLLQDFGIMKIDDILHVIATYLGAEVVSLRDRELPPSLLKIVPANVDRMYRCVPVAENGNVLQVALADPLDPARVDEIGFTVKRDIQVVVADPMEIDKTIERFYGQDEGESFSEILKELGADTDIAREAAGAGDDEKLGANLANEAPIVKFVNLVLMQAGADPGRENHFEPVETDFRIRHRGDGALYEMAPPPKHLAPPVFSRLKVLANRNIFERRNPPAGRINFQ